MKGQNYDPHRKSARVMLAVVIVISVSGYFMGLRQTASTPASRDLAQIAAHEHEENPSAPEVRDYRRMHEVPKPNADWSHSLAKLKPPQLDFSITNAATPAERAQAAQERLLRRAFDGAPPVVPHPIEQHSSASCLSCHSEGKVVKGRVASKMSHQPYSSCTQCHVPADGRLADGGGGSLASSSFGNDFEGLKSFGSGNRAYLGAPPTIPHPTSMRSDCMSCHGPGGLSGLRTSHAWRQSCTQCHVPSAELDQRGLIASEEESMKELHQMLAAGDSK